MSLTAAWNALKRWLDERERARALAKFTCAHCDRSGQCGRAPSEDCIERHEQIARGDDWRYRPAAHLRGKVPYE